MNLLDPAGLSTRERWARLGAFAIIGGMAIANVIWTLQTWPMGDTAIYWDAGQRIRSGEPLYPGEGPYTSFRYAPWFAWAWAGLTYLPFDLVAAVWHAALLVACGAVAIPFLRRGPIGIAFAGIMVPLLFAVSGGGNVQPLIVASLLHGLNRPSGPVWVATAASLRATPVLFAAVYAARREWRRFWLSIGLTGLLVAPMLLYEPEALIRDVAGREPGLLAFSPVVWAIVAIGATGVVVAFAVQRSRYAPLTAAAAAVLASPKLFGYDVTTLAAVPPNPPPEQESRNR